MGHESALGLDALSFPHRTTAVYKLPSEAVGIDDGDDGRTSMCATMMQITRIFRVHFPVAGAHNASIYVTRKQRRTADRNSVYNCNDRRPMSALQLWQFPTLDTRMNLCAPINTI